jgi:hypothetical protein
MNDKLDYSPLLPHEWEQAKQIVAETKSSIPKHLADTVWYLYNKIKGTNERQPCTCASSGNLWGTAYTTVKDFVNKVNG